MAYLPKFKYCFSSIIIICCFSSYSFAGFVELGTNISYRTSTIDEFNKSITESYTASLAYYFWEMSAFEFSYTNGNNRTHGRTSTSESYEVDTNFELVGLDLIISFAGKQAPFRPYIKFGGAYQKKRSTYRQGYFSPYTKESEGVSPTAGGGFKIMLTEQFALKAGVDMWTSPMSEAPVRYDMAASAGISWIF